MKLASYELRPMAVFAVELTWENWQEVTDLVHGQFRQTMKLSRSSGLQEMSGVLEFRNGGVHYRAEIGDLIVATDGEGYIRMDSSRFHELYQPTGLVVTR